MYFSFKWCGCIWTTIAKPGTHDVHKYEGYIKCSAQCERGNLFLVITVQSSNMLQSCMINVSNPKFQEIRQFMVSGYKKPNAAVGQSSLQALYETMFRNYGIMVGQVFLK